MSFKKLIFCFTTLMMVQALMVSPAGANEAPVEIEPITENVRHGWIQNSGDWYFYQNNVRQTGWVRPGTRWYFLDETGRMQTGWITDSGDRFFLNPAAGTPGHNARIPYGAMHRGWSLIDDSWFFMNNSGRMQTDWVRSGNRWYFLNTNGVMQTGWIENNNSRFFLNPAIGTTGNDGRMPYGAMHTGWSLIGNSWFNMRAGGQMRTGWVRSGGLWYFMAENGVMQTGWIHDNDSAFFLTNSGAMQTGRIEIDGLFHHFGSGGHWLMRETGVVNNVISEQTNELQIGTTGIRVSIPRNRTIGLGNAFNHIDGIVVQYVNSSTVTNIPVQDPNPWFWNFSHNGQVFELRFEGLFDHLTPGDYNRILVVQQGENRLGQVAQSVQVR